MISIYALINPLDNQVFYIGASMYPKQRLANHCSATYQGTYKDLIVENIIENDRRPELLILDLVTYEDAAFFEDFYADLFRFYGFMLKQGPSNYKGNFLSTYQKKVLAGMLAPSK